ncbi:unnamed protein product [Periconia digitata]|uniref:Uncharacterized protein n=1 Tax=Periconia digitata TaxID=1303443 RepID=A0A9W4XKB9_9PLEO|nr:unnamed protein product [Periconia digitata]
MAVDILASLSCDCLILYKYAPTVACNIESSQGLSWRAAQSFASTHNLYIIFASQRTATEVFEVKQPLPTSVLMSMHISSVPREIGSAVVCGKGNERKIDYSIKGRGSRRSSEVEEPATGLMSAILGVFILFIILYAIMNYLWSKSLAKRSRIKLDGTERRLSAHAK